MPSENTEPDALPAELERYIALGKILERFLLSDGVIYWHAGAQTRPYEEGQEGGITIDTSIVITAEEVALLDLVAVPWGAR